MRLCARHQLNKEFLSVEAEVHPRKMVDDGSEKMEEAQRARALAEESELLGIDGLDPAEAVLAKADGLAWEWKAPPQSGDCRYGHAVLRGYRVRAVPCLWSLGTNKVEACRHSLWHLLYKCE